MSRLRRILFSLLLLTAFAFLIFSGLKLFGIFNEYDEAENEYSELADNFVSEDTADGEESLGRKKISVDFESLFAINDDIIGWIEVPACKISYPIVQTKDNSYYLTHTFEDKLNSSGAIFLDADNSPELSDHNSLIYGHNMKNKSMFGSLKSFYQEVNLRSANPYFYIVRPDGTELEYEIFSYYIADDNSDAYRIPETEEEFRTYIDSCLRNSIENTGVLPDTDDRIVTLATCSGASGSNKRFFVHGVLRRECN